MGSAFNLLVFPNSMFTPFFHVKGYVLFGEIVLNDNHYYYYYDLNDTRANDRQFFQVILPLFFTTLKKYNKSLDSSSRKVLCLNVAFMQNLHVMLILLMTTIL